MTYCARLPSDPSPRPATDSTLPVLGTSGPREIDGLLRQWKLGRRENRLADAGLTSPGTAPMAGSIWRTSRLDSDAGRRPFLRWAESPSTVRHVPPLAHQGQRDTRESCLGREVACSRDRFPRYSPGEIFKESRILALCVSPVTRHYVLPVRLLGLAGFDLDMSRRRQRTRTLVLQSRSASYGRLQFVSQANGR